MCVVTIMTNHNCQIPLNYRPKSIVHSTPIVFLWFYLTVCSHISTLDVDESFPEGEPCFKSGLKVLWPCNISCHKRSHHMFHNTNMSLSCVSRSLYNTSCCMDTKMSFMHRSWSTKPSARNWTTPWMTWHLCEWYVTFPMEKFIMRQPVIVDQK